MRAGPSQHALTLVSAPVTKALRALLAPSAESALATLRASLYLPTRLLAGSPTRHDSPTHSNSSSRSAERAARRAHVRNYEARIRYALRSNPVDDPVSTLLTVVLYKEGLHGFSAAAQAGIAAHGLHIAVRAYTAEAARHLCKGHAAVHGSLQAGMQAIELAESLVLRAVGGGFPPGESAVPVGDCRRSVATVLRAWAGSATPRRAVYLLANVNDAQPDFHVRSLPRIYEMIYRWACCHACRRHVWNCFVLKPASLHWYLKA